MKNLFIWFVVFLLSFFDSIGAMPFRNALRIPTDTMGRIHQCAIGVNSRLGLNLVADSQYIGKYNLEGGDSVICAFLKDIPSADPNDIVSFITKNFSNREIIITGYGDGANYAEKIVDILGRCPNFEENQVKLIVFCAKFPIVEDLQAINLSCTLHFSHAFEKIDFYGSKAIEIPVSKFAEIRSKINFCDSVIDLMGIGSMGASYFFGNALYKTISFVSGLGFIVADTCAVALREPQQCLSDSGICEAYERAKKEHGQLNLKRNGVQ